MSIPVTQLETRITCSEQGLRNDLGKPKLIAKIIPDGILVWCKYCRLAHRISKSMCLAAWEYGESAVKSCEQEQAG